MSIRISHVNSSDSWESLTNSIMYRPVLSCKECHLRPRGEKKEIKVFNVVVEFYRIKCPNCGRKTRWRNTDELARKQWNSKRVVAQLYTRFELSSIFNPVSSEVINECLKGSL